MPTYVMFGKYSLKGLAGINAKRSDEARAVVEQRGGEIEAVYALLGEVDLVAIVELPDTARAMQTSAALSKLLGADFTTAPAVTADEFDKLMAVI
jgi:uncharacterized protein with GYD domain